MILLISARITGVSHWCLAEKSDFDLSLLAGSGHHVPCKVQDQARLADLRAFYTPSRSSRCYAPLLTDYELL
jgi:hypothetical protein